MTPRRRSQQQRNETGRMKSSRGNNNHDDNDFLNARSHHNFPLAPQQQKQQRSRLLPPRRERIQALARTLPGRTAAIHNKRTRTTSTAAMTTSTPALAPTTTMNTPRTQDDEDKNRQTVMQKIKPSTIKQQLAPLLRTNYRELAFGALLWTFLFVSVLVVSFTSGLPPVLVSCGFVFAFVMAYIVMTTTEASVT